VSVTEQAPVDVALDELLSAMAARFPIRAAVLRRVARRPAGRAVVVAGVLRAFERG